MVVLDASASMSFPVATRTKWRQAQLLAIGLSAVAHGGGDPVGVAVQDERAVAGMRIVPPRGRRDIVSEVARFVEAVDPDGVEPLAPVLGAVRARRVAIVTDLLGDADALLAAAQGHVATGGEVALLHVISRDELDPPRRTLLVADPENGAIQRLLTDGTRREYEHRFAAWRDAIAGRWQLAGAMYATVLDDEPPAHAIRRIVQPSVPGSDR